jgi:hypothetical protein
MWQKKSVKGPYAKVARRSENMDAWKDSVGRCEAKATDTRKKKKSEVYFIVCG